MGARSLPSAVALEDVLRRGRDALASGHLEGAVDTFDAALRMKPTYAPAWRAKGRALRAAGDLQNALECYAEALRHEPDDEASWFGLGLTLHSLGRPDEEVQAYDELLRRNPKHVAARMNRGVALHESGRYEDALACYDEILEMRPEFAPAWNNRGAVLLRLNRTEEALEALNEALALDPANEDAAANRKAVLERLGRDDPPPPPYEIPMPVPLPPKLAPRALANLGLPAVAAWRRHRPETPDDYVALGTALLEDRMPALAAGAFAKAEAGNAGPVAAVGKLLALEAAKDSQAASVASRTAEAFPEVPRVALAVARVRESTGDREGAMAALDALLARKPDLAWAWGRKGMLALQSGEASAAVEAFRRATELDPGDPDAWANLAASLHREGKPGDALSACDRALALNASHHAAMNNRGVILAHRGEPHAADQAFRAAAKATPSPSVTLNRAHLAESRGRHSTAARLYEKARSMDPEARESDAGLSRTRRALRERDKARTAQLRARLESVPGIGPATAKRVLKAGMDTAAKVRRATTRALRDAGLTPAQARAVRRAFKT